jgi:methyl-accepting chemotaxis protein
VKLKAYLRGIGAGLIGAQLLVVVLAIGGFATAIASFRLLDRVFGVVIDQQVPVLTAALTLARDGEKLNVSAPLLAAAATDQQRESEFQAITRNTAALEASLKALHHVDLDAASLDEIAGEIRQLEDNLAHLNALVAEGLKADQAAQALLSAMAAARDTVQAELGPAIGALTMRIALGSKAIQEHASREGFDDLVNALGENRPMLALQTALQQASDALTDASSAPHKDALDQLSLKQRGAMKIMRVALKDLPAVLRGRIQGRYDEIARYGDAKSGIPALRSARLDLAASSRALIDSNRLVTDAMAQRITVLTDKARADIQSSSKLSRDLLAHRSTLLQIVAALIVAMALSISFLFVGRRIVRPLVGLIATMQRLAGGDLAAAIPGLGRRDEIGAMAAAVQVFQQHMATADRLAHEQERERERSAAEKQAALSAMADTIEAATAAALVQVSERSQAMAATANDMRGSAARTGSAAQSAAAAAAQALANAQMVASAAEQLSSSIQEIGTQMAQSASVVGRAVAASGQTRSTMEALTSQIARIGNVAEMIGEIAARTNLLALNATIEAARAGEAGRGFAVVASEVKALASQTTRSTQEIAQSLAEIRAANDASVRAVGQIEQTIAEVNSIAGSIAAAVEQQGAATAEIARNVSQAATAANAVAGRVGEVSAEAAGTDRRADEVQSNSVALAEAVGTLRRSVVRVVRTSTAEVDRRAAPRFGADLACRVDGAGSGGQAARVVDLSAAGACIAGGPALPVGARGNLVLDSVGAPVPFTVRAAENGMLHVMFAAEAAAAERLRSVLDRLEERSAA